SGPSPLLVKVITRGKGSFTRLCALTDSSHCRGASARVVSKSVIMEPPSASKRGLAAPVSGSVFARGILGEVFMIVGVVVRLDRIRLRQIAGIGLTVTQIVGACHHVEVTQLMDYGAGTGIGPSDGRRPEALAQIDLVGLIRIDVGEVALRAAAVEDARVVVDGILDLAEVRLGLIPTGTAIGREPAAIALAIGLVDRQIAAGVVADTTGGIQCRQQIALLGV